MNKMINKEDLHEAVQEAAVCCAKRLVNCAREAVEAEKRFYEAPNDRSAECEESAAKAWHELKKRGMNSMKRLVGLAERIAANEKRELSVAEVICEAIVW